MSLKWWKVVSTFTVLNSNFDIVVLHLSSIFMLFYVILVPDFSFEGHNLIKCSIWLSITPVVSNHFDLWPLQKSIQQRGISNLKLPGFHLNNSRTQNFAHFSQKKREILKTVWKPSTNCQNCVSFQPSSIIWQPLRFILWPCGEDQPLDPSLEKLLDWS